MNQFRLVTMIARTTPGTQNPRITAQTVTHHLREIGEIFPCTMYVLYAAFFFFFGQVYITDSSLTTFSECKGVSRVRIIYFSKKKKLAPNRYFVKSSS